MEKYGYELWYDGNCITEDHGFDSEEEAIEEARSTIEDRMDLWISDRAAFDKDCCIYHDLLMEKVKNSKEA